ncbi:hypothetical protein G6F50_015433 [Rhizopus delemar]|uniref:Uncharacterized protein n=1 Tax=Rhizopus delemar TaxID=936053 RepID=A0A9P6XYW2_9FUNG|nr:hypothetical protein G6F50_015433 [Rhizopus delemar]
MAAAGLDPAVGQHQDAIGHAYRGETVGNQYGSAIIRQFPEPLEHFELAACVQRCRWLVQDHHLRIAHPRAGNGDLLPLATGQVHTLLEAAADQLVVAAGQFLDHFLGHAAARGVGDACLVIHGLDLAAANVLAGAEVVAHEVLEDHPEIGAQVVQVVVAQVAAIEQDAALVRASTSSA